MAPVSVRPPMSGLLCRGAAISGISTSGLHHIFSAQIIYMPDKFCNDLRLFTIAINDILYRKHTIARCMLFT